MSIRGLCELNKPHPPHEFEWGSGAIWSCPGQRARCRNCDDRQCMGCVARDYDHTCQHDCPDCGPGAGALEPAKPEWTQVLFHDEEAFLQAWLRGVEIAGTHWFCDNGAAVTSKWDRRPDFDLIQSSLGVLSSGEAAFLAAMYSFYNPDEGGKMLAQLGLNGPGALSAVLDEPRRRVIADLAVSYAGW